MWTLIAIVCLIFVNLVSPESLGNAARIHPRSMNITTDPSHWSYEESDHYGPSHWSKIHSECGGMHQSPINIERSDTYSGRELPLIMDYFLKPIVSINITNTGHSVNFQFNFIDSKPNRLYWNGVRGPVYVLNSLHFHWGNFCGGGSEHTIDGHRYGAEAHLVHFNEKYESIEEAVSKRDGLAVVGIFLESSEEDNNDGTDDNKFVKYLEKVKNVGQSYLISNSSGIFSIRQIIKHYISDYYSYQGSLTTPSCDESVRWIISKKTIKVYPSEIEVMNKLLDDNGKRIVKNYRPIQKLNGRIVYEYQYSTSHILAKKIFFK